MAKKQKELGGNDMSTGTKVVIIVFAVIMALSMMLPTLASVVASDTKAEEAAQEEVTDSESATTESTSSESGSEAEESEEAAVPDNESLKSLATQYEEAITPYKEKLEEDSENLAALLNVGQRYMSWGYSAYNSSTTDEEKAYSKGLLDKAVSYFDKYLALNDSVAVKVDRAMCSYYGGDTDAAIAAVEKITQDSPDSALAWVNLGLMYESTYENDKATEAYKKAAETDPDDEYGVKTYANKRLIAINSTVDSPADAGEASADNLSSTQSTGLSSTLADDAGLDF